jgi:DNA topoisomerase-3
MVKLIIAEKPSVARDIARVLGVTQKKHGYLEGKGYLVTWCVGHLVQLCDPHEYNAEWKRWTLRVLPMMPERFALRATEQTKDQFQVVERLLQRKDLQSVINACDAGREGELIFRYVTQLADYKGKIERLWISSMTDEAIQDGFSKLRTGQAYDALWDAARCRSEADWLVGINATRAMTLRARDSVPQGQEAPLFSVGRVQTPTLALLVEREKEIRHFTPKDYWQIEADFKASAGSYRGRWFRQNQPQDGQDPQRIDRFDKEEEALAILAKIEGQEGRIQQLERKKVKEPPPLLFDLNRLQRTANKRYGFSAAQTLEIAQSLYEKHKAITYPRTDSMFLSDDMKAQIPATLDALQEEPYAGFALRLKQQKLPMPRRVFNNAKVSDHHAIIPTTRKIQLQRLAPNEKKIYDLIVRRFLCAFYPDALFEKTLVITVIAEETFITRGKIVVDPGWREVAGFQDDPTTPAKPKPKQENEDETRQDDDDDEQGLLPPLQKGEIVALLEALLLKKKTQPPPRFTEASLLAAMEGAGRLLDDEDLQQALKDSGLGTPATRASIIETLLSRHYAYRKGKTLYPTEKGMQLIQAIPAQSLRSPQLTGEWEAFLARIARGEERAEDFERKVRIYVQRLIDGIRRASMPSLAASLQADTEAHPQHTPKNKEDAQDTQEDAVPKRPKTQSPRSSAPSTKAEETAPKDDDSLGACPVCGSPVKAFPKVVACTDPAQKTGGCGWKLFPTVAGKQLSPAMLRDLLQKRKTRLLKGFTNKQGKSFEAHLILDDQHKIAFLFENNTKKGGAASPPTTAIKSDTAASSTATAKKNDTAASSTATAKKNDTATSSTTIAKTPPAPAAPKTLATAREMTPPPPHPMEQEAAPSVGRCPRCKEGQMIQGRTAWGCEHWREGCKTLIPFIIEGCQLAPAEARRLLERGKLRPLEGFNNLQGEHRHGEIILDLEQEPSIVRVIWNPVKV